jgi:hypothetical protein
MRFPGGDQVQTGFQSGNNGPLVQGTQFNLACNGVPGAPVNPDPPDVWLGGCPRQLSSDVTDTATFS